MPIEFHRLVRLFVLADDLVEQERRLTRATGGRVMVFIGRKDMLNAFAKPLISFDHQDDFFAMPHLLVNPSCRPRHG